MGSKQGRSQTANSVRVVTDGSQRLLFHQWGALLGLAFLAANCGGDSQGENPGDAPNGVKGAPSAPQFATSSSGGGPDAGTGGPGTCAPNMTGILRDFRDSHPDFEKDAIGDDHAIVEPTLGSDHKPVYAGGSGTATTHGKSSFDQWYRDTPGVNSSILFTVPVTTTPDGISSYDNEAFFPIDGQGFGDQGRDHNFHFTFELHTEFMYKGGETFHFRGDDDLWTYINGKLAIDLGGVHRAEDAEVRLDDHATELGLERGKTYPLDIFNAERHTVESHFRFETSIGFTNCSPIILR